MPVLFLISVFHGLKPMLQNKNGLKFVVGLGFSPGENCNTESVFYIGVHGLKPMLQIKTDQNPL